MFFVFLGNLSTTDVGAKGEEKEHELLQQDGGCREQERCVDDYV